MVPFLFKAILRSKLGWCAENFELASAKDGGIVGARNGMCCWWRLPTAWCELVWIVRGREQAAQPTNCKSKIPAPRFAG